MTCIKTIEIESSEQLLARVATGDKDALAALYDAHASVLSAVARRIAGDAEAEDVLHDALVAVWERAGSYNASRGSPVAWLVCIVRNFALDRVRRRGRRTAALRKTSSGDAHLPPNSETDLDARRARRLVANLPEEQRTTLERAFFDGLSYAEIALEMRVPIGTVKSRAARGLRALRGELESRSRRVSRVSSMAPRSTRKFRFEAPTSSARGFDCAQRRAIP
jgi:RNA polymerase sigma-70 factor (ECF subfamily)